jgi:hypothetical protein
VAPTPTTSILHNQYRVITTHEHDDFDEPVRTSLPFRALARRGASGEQFEGHDREDAKTSIAQGGSATFGSIAAVRASLASDSDMRALGITKASDSERTAPEQGNVTVKGLILAISKEADNDFHLIVGDPECDDGGCLINVEVSGLPPAQSPDATALKEVRSKFLAFFDGKEPGTSRGYDKFEPGIPVTLTGSLFFDVDHAAGAVGPKGLKPDSAWEIHPLSDITFQN